MLTTFVTFAVYNTSLIELPIHLLFTRMASPQQDILWEVWELFYNISGTVSARAPTE